MVFMIMVIVIMIINPFLDNDYGNFHTVILQSKKTGMELSNLHLW